MHSYPMTNDRIPHFLKRVKFLRCSTKKLTFYLFNYMIQSIDELSFGKQQFSPEQHLYTMNRQYLNLHFSAQPLAGSICTWSRLPAFVTYSGHKSMLIFTSTGCPPPPLY